MDDFSLTLNVAASVSVPSITTVAASATNLSTATVGGNVTADGGASVTNRGVVYKTSASVTISDNKTQSGTGTGSYTVNLTGLSTNQQYFFRAYADNSAGSALGSELSFWTLAATPAAPTVNNAQPTSLDVAIGSGDGNPATTTYAIQMTNSGSYVQSDGSIGASAVWQTASSWSTKTVTGLANSQQYGFRVKARNGENVETDFGTVSTGTTTAGAPTPTAPSVNTPTSTSVGTTTATLGGTIASTNNAPVTERGIFWSTTSGFTPPGQGTKVNQTGTFGNGTFTVNVTGLPAGSTIYYEAYASNSAGSGYSAESSFVTVPNAPAVSSASSVADTSFAANWSAATGATNYLLDASSASDFSSFLSGYNGRVVGNVTTFSVTNLSANTLYYYRVRTQNSGGTSTNSASQTVTTTTALPSVTTAAVSNQTASTADSGGNVTSDGGSSITNRGVVWNTSANPTVSLTTKTSNGTGTGAFNSTATGLTASTVYYIRAFAQSSAGTGYGSDVIFTTTCFSATVSDIRASATNSTDFTAAWSALAGASSYRLDVSTQNNFAVGSISSATVVAYNFNTGPHLNPSTQNPAITASVVSISTGSISTNQTSDAAFTSAPFIQSTGGWATNSPNSAKRFAFTVYPVSGQSVSITNIALELKATAAGPSAATINIGNGLFVLTTNLGSGSFVSINTAVTNLGSQASSFDVTIAGWTNGSRNTAGTGDFRVDSIVLQGTVGSQTASFLPGYSNLTVSGTSQPVTGLTEDVIYYFRVRGVGGGSCVSDNSATVSVTTVVSAAAVPTISSATNITGTSFFANWSSVAAATAYQLDVATDTAFTSYVAGYSNRNVGLVTTFAVTNLSPVSTYYYRVRSLRNSAASANSSTQTVNTGVGVPTVGSPTFTSVRTNSATLGGTITATNGGATLEYGVYWSTTNNFTAPNGSKVVDEGFESGGIFTVVPGNLPAGSVIYFQAFARNSGGEGYSSQSSFTTMVAAVTASEESNITPSSFSANWLATTGATNYFLDVGIDSLFSDYVAGYSNRLVGNVLTFSVTNLSVGETYYYRVRAQSAHGTGANSATITALTGSVEPTVSTFAASNITYTAARVGGNVTSTGGATVTNRGIVYATSATPTLANTVVSSGDGLGAYTIDLSGLTPGQTYYVRAFAQNENGTAYGSQISFATTTPTAPSVTTVSATNLSETTAQASGTVTSENGASVTNRGIVWGTNTTPTIANSKTDLGAGSTSFTGSITGLIAGQTYYARAFAQNSAGAGYGSSILFTANCFSAATVVTGLRVTDTNNNSFTAAWDALAGADSYLLDVSSNVAFQSSVTVSKTFVSYTFPSANSLAPTTVDSSITASVFSVTSGTITSNQTSDASFTSSPYIYADTGFNTTNWATAKKFQFTVYPLAGQSITITNIYFEAEATSAGPSAFRVDIASNSFSYATNLGNAIFLNVNQPVTGVANYSTPIVITIAGYTNGSRNTSGSGQFKIDTVQLRGTMSSNTTSFVDGYSNLAVNGTSASVTNLSDNRAYYFRVRPVGGGSCVGGNSATQSVTTLLGPPAVPTSLPATNAGLFSFDANWSEVGNADSYRLDVASDSGFTSYVSGYSNRNVGAVLTFSVTNLNVPVTYYYRVRAVNTVGTSPNSTTQSVSTIAAAPTISTPASSDVTVSSATLGATIISTNGASVTEWGVYWSTVNNFTAPAQGTKVSDTGNRGTGVFTVSATGLNAGSTIYYVGYAINSAGTNYTTQSSFVTLPNAPAIAAASGAQSTFFTANWTAAVGATAYFLDVSTLDTFTSFIAGYSNRSVGNVTSFSVTNVNLGTYYYRVRAQNASGTSTNSATQTVVLSADVPGVTTDPATDITLTTAKSGGNVTSDGGDAVTNRGVVWSTSINPAVSLSTKTSDGSGTGTFTNFISNLSPGQTYYVRAYAQSGIGTGYGSNETFTTTCFTAGPDSLTITYTNSQTLTASWSAVTSASFYQLDVSENPNFGTAGSPGTSVYHNGQLGQGTGGTWTETGIDQGSGYLQLLNSTDALITPAMNFNTTTVETLTFSARTFGGVSNDSAQITVSISTNNGTSYTNIATRTPASNSLIAMSPVDLSSYNGTQVRVRFMALNSDGSRGVGIDDVAITNIGEFSYAYVAGYSNRVVSGTSSVVTGLTQNTTYYLRARADGDGTCVSAYSPTGSVLTLPNEFQAYFSGSSATVTEHAGTANIPVALSLTANVTVQVAVVSGTATEGVDYSLSSTNIVFSEGGATTSNIVVTVIDDTEIESTETIGLQITTISGADFGPTTNYTLTITDNEPSVSMAISSTSIVENVGIYGLVINKSAGRNNVSGNINISGTATLNTDYSLSATNFTLNGATTSTTISVTISNDSIAEFTETIIATLTNISLATTGFPAITTISVTDDNDGNTLGRGDFAIIGFHSTDPDDFAIVALTNIPANTRVNFTDNGITGAVLSASETTFAWLTPAGGVSQGQVVTFSTGSVVSAGTVNGSFSGLSTAGDQILAYQGDATAPTFIYAINFEGTSVWQSIASGTSQSELPPGLTNGTTAVALTEADNGSYTGSRTGDPATLLSNIGNPANWTMSDTRASVTFNTNSFSVTGPVPEIAILGTNLANIANGDITPLVSDGTDFGTISITATKDHVFTVTNSGTGSLTVSGVTISGAHSNDFIVQSAPAGTVAASSSTTFTLRFDPTYTGARTGLVTVANNDSDEGTFTFRVVGRAPEPAVSFAYSSTNVEENVGTVAVGINLSYAADATVRVDVASGGTATSGSDFSLSATQFVFTAAGSTSQTLTVTVTDDSTNEETESFTLRFVNQNNATNGSPSNVVVNILYNDAMATLSPGDIAVIGRDYDADSFSIVALTNIAAGHIIYFTDGGWNNATNGIRGTEALIRLTINSEIAAGTIIRSTNSGAAWTWTTSGSAPVSGSLSPLLFTSSGDQIIAFQVPYPTNTAYLSDKQFIYMFDDTAGFEDATSTSTGNEPPGLSSNANTAISLPFVGSAVVGLNMSYTETNANSKAGWLAYINNSANWTTSSSGALPTGTLYVGTAPALLAAPALSAATSVETNSFQINWSAVSGASSYRLDVSGGMDFTNFVAGFSNRTVGGTSQTVTGLTHSTTYYYRLRTVNAGGIGANSATGSTATRTPQAPDAPTAQPPTLVSNNSFRASWDAVSGSGISYRLDVSTTNSFASFVTGFSNRTVNTTSELVTSLASGTRYHYRVRAANNDGVSTNSNMIVVVLPASNVVGIVTNSNPGGGPAVLPPAAVSNKANLAFGGADGARYDVFYSDDQGTTWRKQETLEATGSVHTVEVTENNSNRFFRVIPTGQNPTNSESPVVGVIKPQIRPGSGAVTFISPPVDSDRNMQGDFGSQLATNLANGTKVFALTPGTNVGWTTFTLNKTTGQWTKDGDGSYTLAQGQGLILQNVDGTSQIRFSGQINDTADKTASLAVGFNIIGLSEGKSLNASTAFESANPYPDIGNDPNKSDQVWIQNSDGSWRRLSRRTDGTWQDTSNPSATNTTLQLQPGESYYYIRKNSSTSITY